MLNSFDINSTFIEDDDIDLHVHHYFFIIFTTSTAKVLVKVCKTNSQIRDTLICQSRMKVKVVKMCLKGWNEPILKWKRTTWFKLYSLKVKRQDNSTFWKINSYILMINVEKAFWLIDLLSVLRMSEAFDLGRCWKPVFGEDDSAAMVLLEPSKFPTLHDYPPKATGFHSSIPTVCQGGSS